MRQLVTLRQITDIQPIIDADNIEAVYIDGWIVVSQKNTHTIGDNVLFFEIDSFLPQSDERYESFMKFGTRTFNGVIGHKVKTVRLRGVYSQGIILPVALFPEIVEPVYDVDYSELLGIVKWEAPETTGFRGDAKGSFPGFIRKSDQDRIQNCYKKLVHTVSTETFIGTLKMEGSSITVYCHDGIVGYCSRNQELKMETGGSYYDGAINAGLFDKVQQLSQIYGKSLAIQGELVGPGVQKNYEQFNTFTVFAYNIFDIQTYQFVDYVTFKEMAEKVNLQIVPEIYQPTDILNRPLSYILELSDGKCLNSSKPREGIVWKQLQSEPGKEPVQFKAVSNKFLGKQE